MQHVEHPFPPVVDQHSRILILGSFPSVASRDEGFFYGHPRNRFWPMLADIFAEEFPISISDRQAIILRHHLALWDVIVSCDINGSSDASIRNAVAINVQQVLDHASIQRIICNGALAGKIYQRHLQSITGIEAIVLPSTSPANAAWSLARLTAAWMPHLHI